MMHLCLPPAPQANLQLSHILSLFQPLFPLIAHIEPTREEGPSVDGPLQLDVRGGEVEEKNTVTESCKDACLAEFQTPLERVCVLSAVRV